MVCWRLLAYRIVHVFDHLEDAHSCSKPCGPVLQPPSLLGSMGALEGQQGQAE